MISRYAFQFIALWHSSLSFNNFKTAKRSACQHGPSYRVCGWQTLCSLANLRKDVDGDDAGARECFLRAQVGFYLLQAALWMLCPSRMRTWQVYSMTQPAQSACQRERL
jgi:hypothetical protein